MKSRARSPWLARNHVDYAEECVGSIHRRAGTTNDFDALHQVHIEWKVSADKSAAVDVFIHAVPVDHQQDAGDVVVGLAEATHAQILVITVVAGVKAAGAVQCVAQRTPAIGGNLIGSNDRHRRWSLLRVLQVPGGAVHLQSQQLFHTQRSEVLGYRSSGHRSFRRLVFSCRSLSECGPEETSNRLSAVALHRKTRAFLMPFRRVKNEIILFLHRPKPLPTCSKNEMDRLECLLRILAGRGTYVNVTPVSELGYFE